MPADATHLLVLQDDAVPCDRFPEAAHAAVAERPDELVALFVPGMPVLAERMQRSHRKGERWMVFPRVAFVPVVAVVYPRRHVEQLREFSATKRLGQHRADDGVVSQYARARRATVWATVPCLAQHDDTTPSVMRMPHGKGSPHRLAALWRRDVADVWLTRARS